MNIVIISPGYPNEVNPSQDVFVQKLVHEFADLGHMCYVISPQNRLRKEIGLIKEHRIDVTANGNKINVFYPHFYSAWRIGKFPGDPIAEWGYASFKHVVRSVIDKYIPQVDILYGHFLSPAGTCVADLKSIYNAKAFAAFGESSFWSLGKYSFQKKAAILAKLDGIIAVSSENKRRLLEEKILSEERIQVIPNAINLDLFMPLDKKAARKLFGFDNDAFIAGYVGGFSDRKGILRVEAALKDQSDIQLAFAGKGQLMPTATNVIFSQPIKPEMVPVFLNALDVFVLPTLNEGCCNAIVEAMGCGKAIVSSNRAFNWDVLSKDNSIMVDPENIEEIRNAVVKLKEDEALRKKFEKNALAGAQQLDIRNRAKKILKFMIQI